MVVDLGGEHDESQALHLPPCSSLPILHDIETDGRCDWRRYVAISSDLQAVLPAVQFWRLGRARKMTPDGPDVVPTLSFEADGTLYCRHMRMMMQPELIADTRGSQRAAAVVDLALGINVLFLLSVFNVQQSPWRNKIGGARQ